MEMVSRLVLVAQLCLLAGSSVRAEEPDLKNYVPGKLITVERYQQLSNAFFAAWAKLDPFEAHMQAANDAAEPEALLAGMKLLSDPDYRITYAQFSPDLPAKPGHEIASHDGLLGFRVVRQLEMKVAGKRRLLSSIQTYDWDVALKKMVPIGGADSFRVRAQIDEFKRAEEGNPATGFVGFSWATRVRKGNLTGLEARNNVTDDKKKWLSDGHSGSYDSRATPCSWTTHCNVCHHADKLNAVNNYGQEPLEKKGSKQFLKYLAEERKLTGTQLSEVSDVLADPKKAFPTDELTKALLARWLDSTKK